MIAFNVSDPSFYLDVDPDQKSQTNADPDTGQALLLQKVGFWH
jgi:hypothetical protein